MEKEDEGGEEGEKKKGTEHSCCLFSPRNGAVVFLCHLFAVMFSFPFSFFFSGTGVGVFLLLLNVCFGSWRKY